MPHRWAASVQGGLARSHSGAVRSGDEGPTREGTQCLGSERGEPMCRGTQEPKQRSALRKKSRARCDTHSAGAPPPCKLEQGGATAAVQVGAGGASLDALSSQGKTAGHANVRQQDPKVPRLPTLGKVSSAMAFNMRGLRGGAASSNSIPPPSRGWQLALQCGRIGGRTAKCASYCVSDCGSLAGARVWRSGKYRCGSVVETERGQPRGNARCSRAGGRFC